MRSKTYQTVKAKVPEEAVDTATAVAFLKEHARPDFDETVELHVRLGVDPSKSDQMVRGTVELPSGPPKAQQLVVFTDDKQQQEGALAAGAIQAGGEELIESIINQGDLAADATIATPKLMPAVAKAARILGPKGLMPSPKIGTVNSDPVTVVKELLGGKITFKMDQQGNVHLPIAKLSWENDKISANLTVALSAIKSARPPAARGEFLRSLTLKSTMSPAIRISR